LKLVAEIPTEIMDIINKHDKPIGRRELASIAGINEQTARYYLRLWNSRLADSDPRTLGMQEILRERVSKQAKAIKNLQKELATEQIVIDKLREFITVLDIKSKPPTSDYSKDKIDVREAITIWSDWHAGEVIDPNQIEGLNEYNMSIMAGRVWNMVRGIIRIIELNKSIFNIDTLNIDMLGDMLCILPDMIVQEEDGSFLTIEDFYEKERNLPVAGRLTTAPINEKYKKYYVGNICNIKCAGAPEIKCSEEHKWLVIPDESIEKTFNKNNGGFWQKKKKFISIDAIEKRKADSLKVGDYLLTRGFRPINNNTSIDISAITNITLKQGDGFIYEDIRGNKPKVKDRFIDIDNNLLRLLGLFIAEGSTINSRTENCKNSAQFTFNINEDFLAEDVNNLIKTIFGDFIHVYFTKYYNHNRFVVSVNNKIIATFLHYMCGHLSENKKIHKSIWNAPISLLPLIGGWLDGDGTTVKHAILGKTISKQLAFQIRTGLLFEGVAPSIHTDDNVKKKNWKPAYTIAFTGKYAKIMSRYTKRFKSNNYINGYEEGVWVGPYYAQRIKKVRKSEYSGYVYDLQIKGDPYYQVNTFISHNSGVIHDELLQTNEMPILQTVMSTAYITAQAIAMLVPHFSKIRVTCLSGNHSRLTQKYQFKNKAINNYDTLMYHITSLFLSKYIDEGIIDFNIPQSSECIIVRANWAFLLGHSDHIRGWSGIPWYGFQRDNAKQQKIRKLRSVLSADGNDIQPASELNGAIVNMKTARSVYGYDYRECGHWHTMSIVDDWTTIINGALCGTNEFSLNKLHAVSQPTQTLAFVSEKYGLKGIEPIYCIDEGHNFNLFKDKSLGEYAKFLV